MRRVAFDLHFLERDPLFVEVQYSRQFFGEDGRLDCSEASYNPAHGDLALGCHHLGVAYNGASPDTLRPVLLR